MGRNMVTEIELAYNNFAVSLYNKLKQPNQNVFFSPYSIATALGMVGEGARGRTSNEMRDILPFGVVSQKDLQALYRNIHQIESINLANAVWLHGQYTLFSNYREIVKEIYFGEIRLVNFQYNPSGARDLVNAWVLDKTKQRIKDLIPPNGITDLTRLVLANAIHFKESWKAKFDKSLTRADKFYVYPDCKTINVPMMNAMKRGARYWGDDSFQVLQMPYAGDCLDMTIVLPRTEADMKYLESDMTKVFNETLYTTQVNIWLPKFKIETEYSLVPALKKMGIKKVFEDTSDLSGITPDDDQLKIDGVFHKAFVDVNEEGTEAAAATAVLVMKCMNMSKPPPVPNFKADHPFFFFIRHTESGVILFMGKIMKP